MSALKTETDGHCSKAATLAMPVRVSLVSLGRELEEGSQVRLEFECLDQEEGENSSNFEFQVHEFPFRSKQ